jgi:D-serine deaminase-like pyridoxal phosphate-dependent protein
MHAANLEGISELHPGNYLFFDLFQVYLGSCKIEDIAISILASVIGHRRDLNQLVLDCGQAALSAFQPTGELAARFGCGLVTPIDRRANQWSLKIDRTETEHGMIVGGDNPLPFDALPIGYKVRVAPLSANATAALHTDLMIVQGGAVVDCWERTRGWHPTSIPF